MCDVQLATAMSAIIDGWQSDARAAPRMRGAGRCAVLCCAVLRVRAAHHLAPRRLAARRRVAWKRFTFEILSVGKIMKTPS